MDPFNLGLRHGEPKASVFRRMLQVPFAVATSALVVVGIVVGGVHYTGKLIHPAASNDYTGTGFGTVQIDVHPGQSLSAIGQTLVTAGVVKSVTAFSDAANDNEAAKVDPAGHLPAQARDVRSERGGADGLAGFARRRPGHHP